MERVRRRLWTRLITLAASLVLAAAVVSALFQFVVLAVPGYREDLARHVSHLAGRPVRIAAVALSWRGYYPSLDLSQVEVRSREDDRNLLTAQRVRLGFTLPQLVQGRFEPARLDLEGIELQVRRTAAGEWRIEGWELDGGDDGLAAVLHRVEELGGLRLARCAVTVIDEQQNLRDEYFLVEAELEDHWLGRRRLQVDVGVPARFGGSLELQARFTGDLAARESLEGQLRAELHGFTGAAFITPWLLPGTEWQVQDGYLGMRATVHQGRLAQARLGLQSGALVARRGTHEAGFERLAAAADLQPLETGGWQLVMDRLLLETANGRWPETAAALELQRREGRPPQMKLSLSHARLVDVAPWLALLRADPWLTDLNDVSGVLRQLELRWEPDAAPRYTLRGRFDSLQLPAAGRNLGFAGLDGELAADENGGRVVFHHAPLHVDLPGILEQPLPLERMTGEAEWRREPCPAPCRAGSAWSLRMPRFNWALLGSQGEGSFDLQLPAEGSPLLQLTANFSAADATKLKPFMPRAWSSKLQDWLDRALLAARVPAGQLHIDGALRDFPFRNGGGRFELDIEVADAALAFAPDWPALENLQAQLQFRGDDLSIRAHAGSLQGLKLEQANAAFLRTDEPQLQIDARARGSLPEYYRLIQSSPLRERLAALTENTTAEGEAVVDLSLDIPLQELADVQAAGTVTVNQVSLRYEGLEEPIREIAGRIDFGEDGLEADDLGARFYEIPIRARIAKHPGAGSLLTAEFDWALDARGTGASQLVPGWLRQVLAGQAHWRAMMNFGADPDGGLRLESDLQGMQIALPAPLGKPADSIQPLSLHFSPGDQLPLRIAADYENRLRADLQFASTAEELALRRGLLHIGEGAAPEVRTGGLVMGANLKELDLQAWHHALAGLGGLQGGQPLLSHAEIRAASVRAGSYRCGDLAAVVRPGAGRWQVELKGACADGGLSWQPGSAPRLDAQLAHLVLTRRDEPEEGAAPDGVLDPARLPVLALDIQRLHVAEANLGHATLKTLRIKNGQRLDALELEGGIAQLWASGVWTRVAGRSSAELQVQLNSSDIGAFMQAFGYAPNLDAEEARIEAQLNWAPEEQGIRWPYANGELTLAFRDGQLQAVEPGAGRMLGLINFYALPRRLSLNFRDVVSKGLGFDRIEGRFELGGGHARTDRVEITGPSLRMVSQGRIGLADRDYDQQVTVFPGLSAGVTLGAVLLGGPAAGALALVAQEVLNKPLDQVTQLSYRLTGSWDNPKLEPVRNENPRTETETETETGRTGTETGIENGTETQAGTGDTP